MAIKSSQYKYGHLLPYVIFVLGTALSMFSWVFFDQSSLSEHFFDTLVPFIPWIFLVAGILISLTVAILIYFMQIYRNRAVLYAEMNDALQKEITEKTHIEETKQKMEKALLQGQKLQAMGTLAGGIAHDFNNILYAIIGYTEMAREEVQKDSITHKNLGKVLEGARRGQDLVSRILAFSRRQQHDFQPLNIKTTFESVLSLLRPTIPASVIINLVRIQDDCNILGNQTQIHQVIVNLINNAVDAMEGEGIVTIKMDRILKDDRFLRQFPKIVDANYCKIEISDTGHGIDPATIERIFEPFFTTKEVGKGTGLGLATVHAIVKDHHGEISVTSQLGHGTTFTLLLPEYSGEQNG